MRNVFMRNVLSVCAVTLLSAGLVGCAGSSSPTAPTAAATSGLAASAALEAKPGHAVAAKPGDQTIVQIVLANDGEFDVLQAAVLRAGLVDALNGDDQYTVFAPTDEAFAKLPPGQLEALLRPENKDQLVKILTNHVVPGKVMAADVVKVKEAKTVQGGSIAVHAMGGKVMVDNANVVKTDIAASNGVIHVIDTVIMPK